MLLFVYVPVPVVVKPNPSWTIRQIKKDVGAKSTCEGDIFLVRNTSIITFYLDKESIHAPFSDFVSSILCVKIPRDTSRFSS